MCKKNMINLITTTLKIVKQNVEKRPTTENLKISAQSGLVITRTYGVRVAFYYPLSIIEKRPVSLCPSSGNIVG